MKKQNVITVVVLMLLMTLFMSFVACKPQENPPAPDKVTITFNSNGGSEVKAITIDKGAKVALPNDPTKEGFSFFGWYEDINGEKIFDDTVGVEKDITLFAQWSSNERPPIDPNNLPSDAKLNNMIADVAAAYGVNTAEDMKLDFVAEGFATSGGEKTVYGVAVKGNLALDGDVSLLLTSKTGEVTTTLLGVYAHAGKFYVELGEKSFAINMQELQTIFKAQAINTATPTAGITIDKDLIVGILSLALESKDIQVSTDNYAITVDVAKIWDRLGGLIGGFLLDAEGNAIMNFPGIGDITKENVATWLAENPILVQINVALKENGVALKIDGSYKTTNMISIDIKDASLTNGKFEITEMAALNSFITDKAANATVVNLANFEFGGQINFLNADKASYMTFDWKFVMDLDPFEFVSAVNAANASNNPYGWIEQAMLQDNMFHFQLSHTCTAACDLDGSFCGSKLTAKATNIMDIFFDPTDTGTAKLYANLGLRGLLSQKNIETLLVDVLKVDPGLAGIAASMVAGKFLENWLVPINLKSLTEPMTNSWTTTATNETLPTADAAALDIPSLLKTVNSIVNFAMSAISADSNSLTVQSVGIFDLMDALGLGAILDNAGMPYEKVKGLLSDVLSGTADNSKLSAIQLSCTKVAFGNKDMEKYNCVDQAITYKPGSTTELRNWSNSALKGDVKFADTIKDKNGNIIYSPTATISPSELNTMIGATIEYSYTGWDEVSYPLAGKTAPSVQIVGIKDIDPTKIGVAQTIRLVTAPFEGIGGTLQGIFGLTGMIGMSFVLPFGFDEMPYEITLQELSSVEFAMDTPFQEGGYAIQTASQELKVKAKSTITYADGQTKVASFKAPTKHNMVVEANALFGDKYYMTSQGEYFATYEFAGVERTYKTTYNAPKAIKNNLGTKETPNVVANNVKMFEGGLPTFYKDLTFTIVENGVESDVVIKPADYFFDTLQFFDINGAEVKDIYSGEGFERKYSKLGVYQYRFDYRGVIIEGWMDIQDIEIASTYKIATNKSKGEVTVSVDKMGNVAKDVQLGMKWQLKTSLTGATTLKVGDVALEEYVININSFATDPVKFTIAITFDEIVMKGYQYVTLVLYDKANPSVEYATDEIYMNKKTAGNGDLVLGKLPTGDLTLKTNFASLFGMNWNIGGTNTTIPMTYNAERQTWCFVIDDTTTIDANAYIVNYLDADDKIALSATGTATKAYAKANNVIVEYKVIAGEDATVPVSISISKPIIADGLLYQGSTSYKGTLLMDGTFKFVIENTDGAFETADVKYDTAADKYFFTFKNGTKLEATFVITNKAGEKMDIVAGKPVPNFEGTSEKCTVNMSVTYKNEVKSFEVSPYIYKK